MGLFLYTVSPTLSNLVKYLVKPVSDYYKNYCFQFSFEKKKKKTGIAWIVNFTLDSMVEFNNMRLYFIHSSKFKS